MRRACLAALVMLAGLAPPLAAAQDAATPATGHAAPPTNGPATTTTPPANLEPLAAGDARSILGKKVSDASGKDMGLVVDVLFGANKQPRAAVIDFGGFLGVGTRKLAVDWKLLQFFAPDSQTPLRVNLTRADVQRAPEYKPGAKTISVISGPLPLAPAAPMAPAASPMPPPSSAPEPPAPGAPDSSADAR